MSDRRKKLIKAKRLLKKANEKFTKNHFSNIDRARHIIENVLKGG